MSGEGQTGKVLGLPFLSFSSRNFLLTWLRAHFSVSKCPSPAALLAVYSSQGHGGFWDLAHFNTSRCPSAAASEHVATVQWHPFARAHCRTSRFPDSAAALHVLLSQAKCFFLSLLSASRLPPSAAYSHVLVYPYIPILCFISHSRLSTLPKKLANRSKSHW